VINFESDRERKAKALSVIYREGVLEVCGYDVLRQHDTPLLFPPTHITSIAKAIKDSCSFLSTANLGTDAFVFCSMVNCEGARLVLGAIQFKSDILEWAEVDRPVLTLPRVYVDQLGDEAHVMRQVRPVFDALWNAAGHSHCPHYDDNGDWQTPRI
jgi:hypothetical protein